MFTASVVRKGNMLQNIKKSIAALSKESVDVGYFQSQGKHVGKDGIANYSYCGLAQALELGLTNSAVNRGVPMPFMESIRDLTVKGYKTSPLVKRAMKEWSMTLHTDVKPTAILNGLGAYAKLRSKEVFNNPAYFSQNPDNNSPVWETGELAGKFAFRNSITKQVRT